MMIAFTAAVLFAIFIGYGVYTSRTWYWYVKTNQPGWRGRVHRADAEFGFVPIPGSLGAQIFPIGPEVPMRFDKDGFRIPVSGTDDASAGSRSRPLLLALGCSFTYGAATYAEETYPYLLGQELGGTMKNAGVCSYGLSQMMILAKRLIPEYKPDYLVVQYSPWLTKRAQSAFAPTYFGKLPVPYFSGEDELALNPPVFKALALDLPFEVYRNSPSSIADFVSFLRHVGLPLYCHDNFNMVRYYGKLLLGRIPKPFANGSQIEKIVYGEISRVARANKTKVIVVLLGNDSHPVEFKENIFPDDFILVNAQAELLKRLPLVSPEAYAKEYYHWRGNPARVVDCHPNPIAHRIIADVILSKIKSLPALDGN